HLIDPEDDSCCDADCREEGVGASVVSGGDATPVLELCEQVLDLVALPVDVFVVGEGDLAASACGDARRDAPVAERLAVPDAVVAAVGDQMGSGGEFVQHHGRALVVADLTGAEPEDDRPTGLIAYGMELGVQPALGASDMAGNIPFLSRLAAVR